MSEHDCKPNTEVRLALIEQELKHLRNEVELKIQARRAMLIAIISASASLIFLVLSWIKK